MKQRVSLGNAPDSPTLDANASEPLLIQIADHYRRRILNGALSSGQRLPTCQELGRTLGLAAQTVNRAFDLLAQEGLVHRRRSLGTIVGPPRFQSQPATHRSRPAVLPICMVMRKLTESSLEADLASDYLSGLMEGFNAWECRFEIAYLKPDQPDLDLVQTLVETRQIRGLINLGLHPAATAYLVEKRFPMVVINDNLTEKGVGSVVADHVRGYKMAWREVLEAGHRRVMFFGFQDTNGQRRLRECTAGAKLADLGCDAPGAVFAPDNASAPQVWHTLTQALGAFGEAGNWPTLFFAQTDLIATRLIRALKEHDVQVPGQVSVIGFNDTTIASHFHPSITTLSKPRFKMGLAASQLLLDVLADRPGSRERLQTFPVTLIQRETVSKPNQ